MSGGDAIWLWAVAGVILLFLLIVIGRYFFDYYQSIQFAKMELERSTDRNDYIHWKHELSALRWSIIPGITPEKIKRMRRRRRRRQREKRRRS